MTSAPLSSSVLEVGLRWTARLIATRANGQPAFGFYARDPGTGDFYTVGLMVLTLSGTRVSAMTRFDPGNLPRFKLPVTLADSGP